MTISTLKNSLSRYLRSVRRGESVEILDRDRPVARIIPVPLGERAADDSLAWFDEQVRAGVIKAGSGRFPASLLKKPPPGKPGVLKALLDERRGGR